MHPWKQQLVANPADSRMEHGGTGRKLQPEGVYIGELDVDSPENPPGHAVPKGQHVNPKPDECMEHWVSLVLSFNWLMGMQKQKNF